MSNRLFTDVHLSAEQVTETHRTLNPDHTITTEELPGMVNLYVVIDGGKVLLDQLKASVVLEAQAEAAYAQQQAQAQAAPAENLSGDDPAAAPPVDPPQPQV